MYFCSVLGAGCWTTRAGGRGFLLLFLMHLVVDVLSMSRVLDTLLDKSVNLEDGVLGTESVVLVNVGLALPGVCEPDVGGVDGREVLDALGDDTSLGLEPGGVSRLIVLRAPQGDRTAGARTCTSLFSGTHLLWTTKMASLVCSRSFSRSASSVMRASCLSMSFWSSRLV